MNCSKNRPQREDYIFGNNLIKFFDTLDFRYKTERFDVDLYETEINKVLVLKSDAIRPSLLDTVRRISRPFLDGSEKNSGFIRNTYIMSYK